MAKFHISSDGTPRACSAKIACPIGGQDEHYENANDARAAYENRQASFNPEPTYESYKTLELSDPDSIIDEAYQPTWTGSNAARDEWPTQSLTEAQTHASREEKEAAANLDFAHHGSYWEARMAYLTHEESIAFASDWHDYLTAQRTAFYENASVPLPTGDDFQAALINHRRAAGH